MELQTGKKIYAIPSGDSCPKCGTHNNRPGTVRILGESGYEKNIQALICRECGTIYLTKKLSALVDTSNTCFEILDKPFPPEKRAPRVQFEYEEFTNHDSTILDEYNKIIKLSKSVKIVRQYRLLKDRRDDYFNSVDCFDDTTEKIYQCYKAEVRAYVRKHPGIIELAEQHATFSPAYNEIASLFTDHASSSFGFRMLYRDMVEGNLDAAELETRIKDICSYMTALTIAAPELTAVKVEPVYFIELKNVEFTLVQQNDRNKGYHRIPLEEDSNGIAVSFDRWISLFIKGLFCQPLMQPFRGILNSSECPYPKFNRGCMSYFQIAYYRSQPIPNAPVYTGTDIRIPEIPMPTVLPKKQIQGMSAIVQANMTGCIDQMHHVELVLGIVTVIDRSGKKITLEVPCSYCQECNRFYMSEYELEYIFHQGIPTCQVVNKDVFWHHGNAASVESSAESILKVNGYNVQRASGLSSEERQQILQRIIDEGILSAQLIDAYLDMFIAQHKGIEKYWEAVSKWECDREFVEGYERNSVDSDTDRVDIETIQKRTYHKRDED